MIYVKSFLAKLIDSHNDLSKSVQYYRKLGCNEFCKVESCTYLVKKQDSTGPCSVVKHIGSRRARKKCRGKHETQDFSLALCSSGFREKNNAFKFSLFNSLIRI